MKSIEELQQIRQRTLERINLRREDKNEEVRVVVGMATCGIAAGARPVMMAFMDEINRRHLAQVTVSQTGCIGMCRLEPMVDVYVPGQDKTTYVHMTPEKVQRVVAEHVVNGKPVSEFTIGAVETAQQGDK